MTVMSRKEKTMDPRSYLYGCITGIFLVFVSFITVSELAGIKWQPVAVSRP